MFMLPAMADHTLFLLTDSIVRPMQLHQKFGAYQQCKSLSR